MAANEPSHEKEPCAGAAAEASPWQPIAPEERRPPLLSRRQLFAATGRTLLAGAALACAVVALRDGRWRLRPPGAGHEPDFLARCIRCGLCAQNCPYDVIHLVPLTGGVALGTPELIARTGACQLCPTLPCIKACPTGALDPHITEVKKVAMGLAVLVDRESCLALNGLRCEICYRVCPLIDKAITLEPRFNERTGRHSIFEPVVHSDGCVGCGRCEEACPTDIASIKVLPLELAKGKLGHHYRLGWKEEEEG